MADDPQAKNNAESAETSQEPMPSSKQTPSDAKDASPKGEGKPAPEAKVETKAAPEDDRKLPEGVKDRTAKEFEKLKQELRSEREKRLRTERVFQRINQAQPEAQPSNPDYYNPDTGEVDVNRLDTRIGGVEAQAKQALATAQQIISAEDQKQERVAYKAHPELDPNKDDFNPDFQKAVIGYLANEYAEGKQTTLKQAAAKVKSFSKADLKKAEAAGETKARESLTPKEQASLEATGRSDRRGETSQDLEQLRRRTRRGDAGAIQERLKNIPIVGR